MPDSLKAGEDAGKPRPLSMLGLVLRFRDVDRTMPNRNFCFILGAGASVTSGIKSAGRMVEEWIDKIYHETTNHRSAVPPGWASNETLGITGFNPKDPAGSYSALYRRMFGHDPDAGYAYLEEQMKNADPSFGYAVLGRILAETRHRVVITVNFDSLVADSVSLFSQTYPLVCGHELLASFVTEKLRRPLVLKVHRDLLLGPLSTNEEIERIDPGLGNAIRHLLKNYTPIVLGYGGNDGSLMRCLEELPQKSIPGGIYWCYRDGSAPRERIKKVVAKHEGHLISIMGFDELLMQFGNELGFDVPDNYVLDRAKKRADRIVKQAQELQTRIKQRDSELVSAVSRPEESVAKKESEAVTDAMSNTMRRQDAGKRWWQWNIEAVTEPDLAKRDGIYREAIKQFPNSSELLGNYAVFLTLIRKEHDTAEAMFKGAIEANPDNASNFNNYGNFLNLIRKDHNAAGAMWKRAIDIDPKIANSLGNYAVFLHMCKDYQAAEAMFMRAMEAAPKDAIHPSNYARLLLATGRVTEGLVRLDEAFDNLGPGDPSSLEEECWMYAYCCQPAEHRGNALSKLKTLILDTSTRTGDWDFSGVIAQAKKMKHPEIKWLPKLAEVLSGKAKPSTLNTWPAWKKAALQKGSKS